VRGSCASSCSAIASTPARRCSSAVRPLVRLRDLFGAPCDELTCQCSREGVEEPWCYSASLVRPRRAPILTRHSRPAPTLVR
jgi:hypothetical protein